MTPPKGSRRRSTSGTTTSIYRSPCWRSRLSSRRSTSTRSAVKTVGRTDRAIEATDLDGQQVTPQPVPVGDGGIAVVELPRALRALEVYLFDNLGNVLDDYIESGHSLSWGRSVLNPGRYPGDAAHLALDQAREACEGQRIEFKEWVPLSRTEPKALELLKTVVAFANAEGGALYIGVTNESEVVGVGAPLLK